MPHSTHPHLLKFHLHREITELYITVALMYVAMSMVSIFVPMYLLDLGYGILEIIAFYALDYFILGLLFPVGMKIASMIGLKHSIALSMPLLIANYILLYLLPSYAFLFFITPLMHSLRNVLFWPAFHLDYARFGHKKDLGKEMSVFHIIITMAAVLGPAVTSFLYLMFDQSLSYVFLIAVGLLCLAIVPLFFSKEVYQKEIFSIKKSVSKFINSNKRRDLAFVGETTASVAMIIFWPLLLKHIGISLSDFGYISSAATFVAVLVMIYMGRQTDKLDKHLLLGKSSKIYSLAWLIRAFVTGTFGVLAADIFGRVMAKATVIPMHALIYEKAKEDQKASYFIQNREYSLWLGRILFFAISVLLLLFVAPSFGMSAFFLSIFVYVSIFCLFMGFL